MPTIRLAMTLEQFRQLPRNPAYRYEFLNGTAILSPQTHHFHAVIQLQSLKPAPDELARDLSLRRLVDEDFPELERLFCQAFYVVQPYGSLDEATRLRAAHDALERARVGGDGPWIRQASFAGVRSGKIVAAVIITLIPPGDAADWSSYRWPTSPPADAIARRLGRPHLTWIFVDPHLAGHGLGTTLLCAAAAELRGLGYEELVSTFVLGNHSSMLWHWRNGFRLVPYPGSPRRRNHA